MEFITNNAILVIAGLVGVIAVVIAYYALQFAVYKEKEVQVARQVQQLKNEKITLTDNLAKAHKDYNHLKSQEGMALLEEVKKRNELQRVYEANKASLNGKYSALGVDLNDAVSDKQKLSKEFDNYKAEAEKTEATLRELIKSLEKDAEVYPNSLNAIGVILEETLCAWDGTKVYKAFEYGATKKAEVIAKKDKKSFRKPVQIGYMFDNEFCALDKLVERVVGAEEA